MNDTVDFIEHHIIQELTEGRDVSRHALVSRFQSKPAVHQAIWALLERGSIYYADKYWDRLLLNDDLD